MLKKIDWTCSLVWLCWMLFAMATRLVPHWWNVTAMASFSLFAGALFSRRVAIVSVVCAMLLSDMIIGMHWSYPIFGNWTWFSYSGMIIFILLGRGMNQESTVIQVLGLSISGALFYWLWTNLGVWMISGIYAHSAAGLLSCFILALPFLRHALLGAITWPILLLMVLRVIRMHFPIKMGRLYS